MTRSSSAQGRNTQVTPNGTADHSTDQMHTHSVLSADTQTQHLPEPNTSHDGNTECMRPARELPPNPSHCRLPETRALSTQCSPGGSSRQASKMKGIKLEKHIMTWDTEDTRDTEKTRTSKWVQQGCRTQAKPQKLYSYAVPTNNLKRKQGTQFHLQQHQKEQNT